MVEILKPGYVRWDGQKYVTDDILPQGPTGPPGVSGADGKGSGTLVYRPGGTTVDNVYATWSEVVTAIESINGPIMLAFDDSIVSPAPITSNVDFGSRVIFVPYKIFNKIYAVEVSLGSFTITNLGGIDGSLIILIPSESTGTLAFSNSPGIYQIIFANGAQILNNSDASTIITLSSNDSLNVLMYNNVIIGTSTNPIINLTESSALHIYAYNNSIFNGSMVIVGAEETSITYVHDQSSNIPYNISIDYSGTFSDYPTYATNIITFIGPDTPILNSSSNYCSCDPSSGILNFSLPPFPYSGQQIIFKNATDFTTYAIVLTAAGGQTIDGLSSFSFSNARGSVSIIWNNNTGDWEIN